MKKYLFILLLSVLLVACNSKAELVKSYKIIKVHENISDEVLEDVNGIIEMIEDSIAQGESLTEDSYNMFLDKYEVELDYVNSEEFEFIMALSLLMMSTEEYIDGERDLSEDIDRLYKIAKTGEYQPLNRKNEYYEEFYENVASSYYHNEQQEGIDDEQQSDVVATTEEDTTDIEDNNEDDDIEYDESQDNIDDINFDVNYVVDTDLDNTDITDIEINKDASVDEERYIVLVNLKWDVKNKPKTTKDMLDMYSDHLAAKLADNELIHELVLFWEVPYHKEGQSILKRTYQNKEDGMYLEDEVKETSIFK